MILYFTVVNSRDSTQGFRNRQDVSAQFSVPQIEYLLVDSSIKGSHVYFLYQVFWVILMFCSIVVLFDINVVLMCPWGPDIRIVQSDITIVVPWQLSTGSKHDYLFCYCPLVGILFEVLRFRNEMRVNECCFWLNSSGLIGYKFFMSRFIFYYYFYLSYMNVALIINYHGTTDILGYHNILKNYNLIWNS